jgi:hypothetical protein
MQDCTSVASAAQIETPTVPVVRVTFGLQMTANEFTKKQQDSFREAIASLLAVNAEHVRILAISEPGAASGRRLLTEGIRIMAEVDCGGDAGKGALMVKSLNPSAINAELVKRGLPPAKILEAPKVAQPVPAEPPTEERNKTLVNVVPMAVGGVVGIVALITAAALFVWWRRRTSRGASGPAPKIARTEQGGSQGQPYTQDVRLPQDSQSSDESGLRTRITAPAQPGSNTVRFEVLDLELDEIAASSTTRALSHLDSAERPSAPGKIDLSPRIRTASRMLSNLKDKQKLRNMIGSPWGGVSAQHPSTPVKTQTSTRPTAVAVNNFPKEKLAEMLMADPEPANQGQSVSSSKDLIDTSRYIEVLGAAENHPGASNSGVEPGMDDRAHAVAILRKMRDEGLLVKTEANLILLQDKEETSSGTTGRVGSRVAGRWMECAKTSVSGGSHLEDDQLSTSRSMSSTSSSLPGAVPMPLLNDKPKARPPPLGAWESSAQSSASGSPETPASRIEYQSMLLTGPKDSHVFGMGFSGVAQWAAEVAWAPVDPASPHLFDRGLTTPMPPSPIAQSEVLHLATTTPPSEDAPTSLARKNLCAKRAI